MKSKVMWSLLIISLFYATVCFSEISGYVKDYTGNPVDNAIVTFIDESNPANTYSATTELDGSYEIGGLNTHVSKSENAEPEPFQLHQNYPNPFNPNTTISFYLNNIGDVDLTIYNMMGQKVRTLIRDYYGSAGAQSVVWDGLDDNGINVGSGIYIYRLRNNGQIASKKMLLLDSGGHSMAGNFSYSTPYVTNIAEQHALTKIAADTSYRVVIKGEEIEVFEKSGVQLRNIDPSIDFIVARAGSGYHLSIVHTNDTHSIIEPIGDSGGSARVATLSRILRNQRQNVLMLDAGDRFARTDFNTIIHEANNQIVNYLEYDCMTIGNWDLSYGAQIFADFIHGLNSSVVSCNINTENEPVLNGLFEPYIIKEVGGHKVGLVGVATTDLSAYKNIDNIIIDDIIPSVQKAVDELNSINVDIIIVLSHAGYTVDNQIANVVDGIDIIVGGHSHLLFSNTIDGAYAPYPLEISSPSGDPVLIVQSGCFNNYLGCLDVTFNENGTADYWAGDSYKMDGNIPEDEAVLGIVNDMIERLLENDN
ncbi:metallophosphoesterase [Candidatus Latescibacterota bacterium]